MLSGKLHEIDQIRDRLRSLETLDFCTLSSIRSEITALMQRCLEVPGHLLEKLDRISFSPLIMGAGYDTRGREWEKGMENLYKLLDNIEKEITMIGFLSNVQAVEEGSDPLAVLVVSECDQVLLEPVLDAVKEYGLKPFPLVPESDISLEESARDIRPSCAVLVFSVTGMGKSAIRLPLRPTQSLLSRITYRTGFLRGFLDRDSVLPLCLTDGSVSFTDCPLPSGMKICSPESNWLENVWDFLAGFSNGEWFCAQSRHSNVSDSSPNTWS